MNEDGNIPNIRRLAKDEMKEEVTLPVEVHIYQGPRKPDMPDERTKRVILPLKVMTTQIVSVMRARDLAYQFFHDITSNPNTTEYNGYNTKLSREQGHYIKTATNAIYTHLIDISPSDPDTIMTAMMESQRLTNEYGQAITVFTNDQQLYKVAVNVTWIYPELFINIIPRLGGMHFLMSFVGAVGTRMANTGLVEIMEI